MTKPDVNNQTILTSKDVCEILNISSRTLQNYRDKRIISFTQVGRKLFYRHQDLEAFLNNNHMNPNPY
jgi:hypothetical protein